MNVWELITANSSAPPGSTAWEHLNSQASGGDVTIIIVGGERESSIDLTLDATVNNYTLSSSVEQYLTATIAQPKLSAELNSAAEASICQ